MAQKEAFSSFKIKPKHWERQGLDTSEQIIEHAYGRTGGTGERTKSALIDLGWVKEDSKGFLRPTEKAPAAFSQGLTNYNQDYERVIELKKLYRQEGGLISSLGSNIFKDNPNYQTALIRLQEQAKDNPKSTAAKVIKALDSDTSRTDLKAELKKMQPVEVEEKAINEAPEKTQGVAPPSPSR